MNMRVVFDNQLSFYPHLNNGLVMKVSALQHQENQMLLVSRHVTAIRPSSYHLKTGLLQCSTNSPSSQSN